MSEEYEEYRSCRLCPRRCGVDRTTGGRGFCGATGQMQIVRAALHFWEEPCISGTEGSGAVFFSGCNLHCLYCQNAQISRVQNAAQQNGTQQNERAQNDRASDKGGTYLTGKYADAQKLAQIMLRLEEQGANNINLVTPTHYLPGVRDAIRRARESGLSLPVVYNTSGYETVEALRSLQGLVDIWLPDYKYRDPQRGAMYSHAPDYPDVAASALAEMVRQAPEPCFDARGMMTRGVIVRHLLLPGGSDDSRAVLGFLHDTFGDQIYISILRQYTPMGAFPQHRELERRISKRTYDAVLEYAFSIGIRQAYMQSGKTAEESFIPPFDGTGV